MKTMPLPEIVATLIKVNGCSEAMASAFLNEFAQIIAEGLTEDGNVTVKGIGTFRLIDLGNETGVEFAPDKAMSEAVNAPFSIFEPVELDDEITEEMLSEAEEAEEADETDENAATDEPKETAEEVLTETTVAETVTDEVDKTTEITEENDVAEISEKSESNEGEQDQTKTVNDEDKDTDENRERDGFSEHEEYADNHQQLPPIPPLAEAENRKRNIYASPCETYERPETHHREGQTYGPGNAEQRGYQSVNERFAESGRHVTHEKVIEKEHLVKVSDKSHHSFYYILTALLSLIAGLLIGYFAYDKLNLTGVKSVNISAEDVQVIHNPGLNTESEKTGDTDAEELTDAEMTEAKTVATENPAIAEPAKVEKAKPAASKPEIVTDTVKSNRFLTTMAREHYGKKKVWVYIYEENKAKLDDPDMIAANTVVVIPPAEKYGIKAGDPASEADAERKAAEIMRQHH